MHGSKIESLHKYIQNNSTMDKETAIKIMNEVLSTLDKKASELAKAIELKRPQAIYDILNPNKKVGISKNMAESICLKFPQLNKTYLLTGEGSILKKPIQNEVTQLTIGGVMMVPLVNQYAHAGYMAGYADAVYVESLPKIPWVVDHEYKGKYISFEIRGDSMDDGLKHSYEQGDVVLCREIYPEYWKCKLHIRTWDAFVIVHKTDGIVVKQIINHDVENGIITCHSFNPIYEDFQIDLREVAQLFNVVKQQKNK